MDLNDQFSDAFKGADILHFRWTCIHVVSIMPYTDISRTGMRGRVINVSAGQDSSSCFNVTSAPNTADRNSAVQKVLSISEERRLLSLLYGCIYNLSYRYYNSFKESELI